MKRLFVLVLSVQIAAHAATPDHPTREILFPQQGNISGSLIDLDCDIHDIETLDCDVIQLVFSKPKIEGTPSDEDIDSFIDGMDEMMCSEMRRNQLSLDDPKIQEKLADVSPAELQQMEKFAAFCLDEDPSTRRATVLQLFAERREQQQKTCSVMLLRNDGERFRWDRKVEHWRSVSEANTCGAVVIKTLKSDDGTWWTYSSQTIVTEPDDDVAFSLVRCEKMNDAEPLIWASKGSAIRQNCQIIGESWNE
ncbi:MAG: hypothetical protein AB7I04_00280 [Pseudomonadales bacterium]